MLVAAPPKEGCGRTAAQRTGGHSVCVRSRRKGVRESGLRRAAPAMRLSWTFALLGCSVLLPWQCMLSCLTYMDMDEFPGCSWSLLLSPLFNMVSVSTQVVMLFLGEYVAAWRFAAFATLATALLSLLPIFVMMPDGLGAAEQRFQLTLAACLGMAFTSNGIFQSASSQLAARLSGLHGPLMEWWSVGLGIAGVLPVVIAGAAQALGGGRVSAQTLFGTCAALHILSFGSVVLLHHRGLVQEEPLPPLAASPTAAACHNRDSLADPFCLTPCSGTAPAPCSPGSPGCTSAASDGTLDRPRLQRRTSVVFTVADGMWRSWPCLVAMFIIYGQTFVVYPLVSSKWMPPHSFVSQEVYGLMVVSVFQLFDFCGRIVTTSARVQGKVRVAGHNIWYLLLLRLLLPVFCFAVWRRPRDAFLGSWVAQFVSLALLGFSNGMLTNLVFAWSAATAAIGSRSVVGRAMPLCLCTGIVAGTALSSLIVSQWGPAV